MSITDVKVPQHLILLLIVFSSALNAGTIFSVTNLGTLPGGSVSAANGISSNGIVTGSADSDAFTWSSGSGMSAVSPSGSLIASGNGVNSTGVVVGTALDSTLSTFRAFSNNGSGATLVPTLTGGSNNYGLAINDAGLIVGYSESTNVSGNQEAFSYSLSGSVLTGLGTLSGGTVSSANAVNSAGDIAGFSDSGTDSNVHPAIWIGGTWTDLGLPTGLSYQSGVASAISSSDAVAGTLSDGAGGSMAFVWTAGGGFTLLGSLTPGGDTTAYGINSAGSVVGTADGTAFLYMNSTLYNLNSLLDASGSGWELDQALAINDLGQIVGVGLYNGEQSAFLLSVDSTSDTPEPATVWLLCGGLLLFGVRKFRP